MFDTAVSGVFDAHAATVHLHNCETIWPHLKAVKAFYRATQGAERLLVRAKRAHTDVQYGKADIALIQNAQGQIIAAALLYHHRNDIEEIGSVLVAPDAHGAYPLLRQFLAHHGNRMGKTVALFERLPNDDGAKLDYLKAQRLAEGFTPMHCEHPVYQTVERTKSNMPPSNGGKPPKIGFMRASTGHSGMGFAYVPSDGDACFPFRNSAFTLGR